MEVCCFKAVVWRGWLGGGGVVWSLLKPFPDHGEAHFFNSDVDL